MNCIIACVTLVTFCENRIVVIRTSDTESSKIADVYIQLVATVTISIGLPISDDYIVLFFSPDKVSISLSQSGTLPGMGAPSLSFFSHSFSFFISLVLSLIHIPPLVLTSASSRLL